MNASLRRRSMVGAVALSAGLMLLGAASTVSSDWRDAIKQLGAGDDRVRDAGVAIVVRERAALVQALIDVFDPKNQHGEAARARAAYLLGKMRAPEAVPVLATSLGAERIGRGIVWDVDPYMGSVFSALVSIGRPAVPAMLTNLQNSDDKNVRSSAVSVLQHVLGGKRRVLETLEKAKADAKDPAALQRLEGAIQHTKDLKEDTEPLF